MKFGCCVNMLGSGEDPIGRRFLPALKESGYDYVELPLAQVMDLDEQEFASLQEELERLDLRCECCNNFFPVFMRLTGKTVAPAGVLMAYMEKALLRAQEMGADKVIFGSSGAKNIPAGFPYEKAYGQIVRALQRAAMIAEKRGITIGLEPLNRQEGNLIRNLKESTALMRDVSSERVRLMVDVYHFMLEEERMETLDQCLGQIIHVHIAAVEGRKFPGEPEMEFLRHLKEKGYEGGVSVEAYSEEPLWDLARTRKLLAQSVAFGT